MKLLLSALALILSVCRVAAAPTTPLNNPILQGNILMSNGVPSIAALRAMPIPTVAVAGYQVFVSGCLIAGDGGGGWYTYSPGNATPDNSGTVIQSASGSGAWLLQYTRLTSSYFDSLADAVTAANTLGVPLYVNQSYLSLTGTITANTRLEFINGSVVDTASSATLVINAGYDCPPIKCFGPTITVSIRPWYNNVVYFEHFGAAPLSNPRATSPDSTTAINKLYSSWQSGSFYPSNNYVAINIQPLGIYGISAQTTAIDLTIHMIGNGFAPQFATGFKWIGPDVVGNHTLSMMFLEGTNYSDIENLIFLGLPTATDANRLYAAINVNSTVAGSHLSRRCTFRNIVVNDFYGAFAQANNYALVHGITSSGDNGNDDFHTIDNCNFIKCEYDITIYNQQNVNWRILHCVSDNPKTATLWDREGGHFEVHGLYLESVGPTATPFLIGDSGDGANIDSQAELSSVDNENCTYTTFIANQSPQFTTLEWNFDTSYCYSQTSATTMLGNINSGQSFIYNVSMTSSHIKGTYTTPGNSSGFTQETVSLRNCLDMDLTFMVVNSSFSTIKMNVINCWRRQFSPVDGSTPTQPLTYQIVATEGNAATSQSVTSFYGLNSTDATSLSFGQNMAGITGRLSSLASKFTAPTNEVLTFTGLIPANSVVFGVALINNSSNVLSDNSTYSSVLVGDSTNPLRYGYSSATTSYSQATPLLAAPFITPTAISPQARGAYYGPGLTYSQSGNTLTCSGGSGFLSSFSANSRTFVWLDGPQAGNTETITAFSSGTSVTVSSSYSVTSQHGYTALPFASSKTLMIAPLVLTMYGNTVNFTNTGGTAFTLFSAADSTTPTGGGPP